jgi:hypothetical protein
MDRAVNGTLAPDRTQRTALSTLSRAASVLDGLARIDRAITQHFPENLFADLDRVASHLEQLRRRDGDVRVLACADRIVSVHALFGCETVLRFRYAHDFLYGFDWARWVAREPSARASVGPYDAAFLDYSEARARELAGLVAVNDQKYGPLARGSHRNPFPFRRDVDAEVAIHRALAASGAIPVRAWETTEEEVWDRDYTRLREAAAHTLGLSIDAPPPH